MSFDFQEYLLKSTKAVASYKEALIQSLWSGYGSILKYRLEGSTHETVVVKHISLVSAKEHPRGWASQYAHERKVKSYQVETHWYQHWNERCSPDCRTPKLLGSYAETSDQWIILEDLDLYFPVRKTELQLSEVKVCLRWLANFHAIFLGQLPSGLWEIGSYWHLNTRPDEFKKIEHQELRDKAHLIDNKLNNCQYQTIIHGDAKVANFCFSKGGEQVAAVDFQYVGGGCGMKDVAYFLGSCLSSEECERHQKDVLNYYFSELRNAVEHIHIAVDCDALEEEWRDLYPTAWADFTRFMMGWMPKHDKINDYSLSITESELTKL